MSKLNPTISVGLPVYNGEKYLAIAIESLLTQTFPDFELIISDNGSTDRTEAICREYAAKDARIRYFREPQNRGLAWNFDRVVELSRGEYFRWQAHDDVCAPTLLRHCYEIISRDPSVVLAYPRIAVIDANGQLVPTDPVTWQPPLPACAAQDEADRRGLDSSLPHQRFNGILLQTIWCLEPYGLMRTEALRTTGLLRHYCGAEKVFLAELALRGKFCEVPEVLFFVRRHAEQYTLLPTATAQRDSVKPTRFRWRSVVPRHVRSTWGYFCLIPPAPIGFKQQLLCLGVLLRYVFQVSKWKRILVNTVRDVGITDGYLKATSANSSQNIVNGQTAEAASGIARRNSTALFKAGMSAFPTPQSSGDCGSKRMSECA